MTGTPVAVVPLWPHQVEAVKGAVAEIGDAGRCRVIMACGTGKTIVGAELSAQVAGTRKVLVVVPTLELLAQTARAYARLGSAAGTIAAVCSEQSATLEAAEIREEMDHLHAGVSTDPADVAAWLESPGRLTAFTTYQSLPAVAAAHQGTRVVWDLIVIDEAHRSAGRAGRPWSMIHEDSRIPARRRLYMTATPKIIAVDDADAVSMDNEHIFGREAYHLLFAEAIRLGLLADYRVAVIVVTDDEAARLASSARVLSSAGGPGVPAGMLAAQVALLRASAEFGLRRVITYHHRVHRARRFAQTLLSAADLLPDGEKPALIHAAAVDGGMTISQRRDILRRLHNPGEHATFIANARVLAEGVDVPELDAVMFADTRESATDVVQAVGRALRRGTREQKTATIIIPVLLAEGESAEAALERSAWDTVWGVVRALRAHDERLADWLDSRRAARILDERGDGTDQPLPGWLTVHGMPVTETFAHAMQLRLIETATTAWPEQLARLGAWRDQHGNLAVPADAITSDGFAVGQLTASLRHRRKRGSLTSGQVAALDAIGMIWDAQEHKWETGLAAALAYRSQHGHLEVPAKYVTPDGYRLGSWISEQRRRRKAGIMTAAQAERLSAAGMRWDPVPAGQLPGGELKSRYEAGESTDQLAVACGVSTETMRLALVAAGTTMRPSPAVKIDMAPHVGEIRAAHSAGESVRAIARKHTVTPSVIRRVLDEGAGGLR